MPTEYPRFFQTIVGLTPSRMRQYTPADMEALFNAFQCLTLEDPLADGAKPAEIWEAFKKHSRSPDEASAKTLLERTRKAFAQLAGK